ncbi:hypothetical protein [Aphanothece hegewaldii]|uniref:hypothetical protein n=1 Tax=Aphanothece hegewaldii TaxID=1521625 RepID=UPI0015E6D868|nr:hypothetical protein [Aphanothece hegewaldii]
MNNQELRQQINQKISTLSKEQLNSIWQFIESLNLPSQLPLPQGKTVLERMGGYPTTLLLGNEDLSYRDVRHKIIAEQIQKRHHLYFHSVFLSSILYYFTQFG